MSRDVVTAAGRFQPRGRQAIRHVVRIAANPAADAVSYDFFDGASGEGEHRRAARHGLDHHEPERLLPLNRKQQGAGM